MDLYNMTNEELRSKCRELGIRGYSKKNKQELIDMINRVTLDAPETGPSTGGMITIVAQSNSIRYPWAGKTVGEIRSMTQPILTFPANADGLVNGKNLGEYYVVHDCDVVEFLATAGKKGSC